MISRIALFGALVSCAIPLAIAQPVPDPADPSWIACTRPNGGGLPLPSVISICDGVIARGGLAPVHLAAAYYYRGNAWLNQGNFANAIPNYNQSLILNPNQVKAFNNRAFSYRGIGNTAEAINDWGRVVVMDPSNKNAFANRGILLHRQGKYADAMLDFTRAILLDPKDATMYLDRGLSNYQFGHFPEAVNDFTVALQIDPNNADARTNLPLAQEAVRRAIAQNRADEEQNRRAERERQEQRDRETAAAIDMIAGAVDNYVASEQRDRQEREQRQRMAQQPRVAQAAAPRAQYGSTQVQSPSYGGGVSVSGPSTQGVSTVQGRKIMDVPPSENHSGIRTEDLDANGQKCVTWSWGPNRMNGKDQMYVVSFHNICGKTYSIWGRAILVHPESDFKVRGTGLSPHSDGEVICQDSGGRDACRGFSEAGYR